MSLQPNFFEYPLIDTTTGRSADGIDPTEMLNYFFKKSIGIVNAKPYNKYNSDLFNLTSAFTNSFQNQQYSQYIPLAPPVDITADLNFTPFYSGDIQKKYYSLQYPYLVYYQNIIMTNVTTDYDYSFYIKSNDTIITQNAIPILYGMNTSNFNTGSTYFNATKVYNNDLSFEVVFGYNGDWLFDTDSGIITFYDTPPYDIGRDSPPRISFWRYEGLIGNSSIVNIGEY